MLKKALTEAQNIRLQKSRQLQILQTYCNVTDHSCQDTLKPEFIGNHRYVLDENQTQKHSLFPMTPSFYYFTMKISFSTDGLILPQFLKIHTRQVICDMYR